MSAQSGVPAPFPSTLWSEVLAARDPGGPDYRERMDRLIRRYWRPVFWSIRLRWRQDAEQAADLTQEFFIRLMEGQIVSTADPGRGSFRVYLKHGLDFFMHDALKISYAKKRGGDRTRIPLDFAEGEPPAELADMKDEPAKVFDRAWAHHLLTESVQELVAELEREGRKGQAEVLQALDMAAPGAETTVRDLAERMGVSKSEVWWLLADARRRLRNVLIRRVKEYVADESELFGELDELFAG